MPRRSLLKVPRQERSIETVHAILDAAVRVLLRERPEALNTNRVAAVAGVSPGSLYQYFANREMILAAVAERCVLDARASAFAAVVPDGPVTPEGALRAVIGTLAEALEAHAEELAGVLGAAPLLASREMASMLEGNLLAAIDEGLARFRSCWRLGGPTAALQVALGGCAFVLLRWVAERPPDLPREVLLDAFARTMGALLTGGDEGSAAVQVTPAASAHGA